MVLKEKALDLSESKTTYQQINYTTKITPPDEPIINEPETGEAPEDLSFCPSCNRKISMGRNGLMCKKCFWTENQVPSFMPLSTEAFNRIYFIQNMERITRELQEVA